jgi:hypothetical protein
VCFLISKVVHCPPHVSNGCFYHDIFTATIVSARSLRNSISLAFLLLRGGGARYCNILALSSLVNNDDETNR